MRIWGKIFTDNRLIKDITIEDYSDETRTHKIFNSLDKICREFDLPKPIWMDMNVKEFKKMAKTRFRKECFIEEIDFDYLEIQILDE